MRSRGIGKYSIGFIIADCLLIIEAIIEIHIGKLTWSEFAMLIILSLLFAIPIVALIKKKKRKHKE